MLRHCNAEFMKHVLPRLDRPVVPGSRVATVLAADGLAGMAAVAAAVGARLLFRKYNSDGQLRSAFCTSSRI